MASAKWYVVHTLSGFEQKVKADILKAAGEDPDPEIRSAIEEVVVPLEPAPPPGERRRRPRKKFLPGYILVRMVMTDKTQHFVRHRPSVTGILGNEKGPKALSQAEVDRILHQMAEGAARKASEEMFEEGMAVRITDGPFVNFTGIVEEVRTDKKKLRVLVTIFGRATPVEVDFTQAERV